MTDIKTCPICWKRFIDNYGSDCCSNECNTAYSKQLFNREAAQQQYKKDYNTFDFDRKFDFNKKLK